MTDEEKKARRAATVRRYCERHREEIRARDARNRASNREKRAAASKAYKAANPDKIAAHAAQRVADGRMREASKRYQGKNRETILRGRRAEYAADPQPQRDRATKVRRAIPDYYSGYRADHKEQARSYRQWYKRRGKRGSGPDRDPDV